MSSINDEVQIRTTRDQAYDALRRQAGYRGWWNKVAEVPETVGGEAKLRFVKDGNPIHMRFRIDELRPGERVVWTCVAHDLPSWIGTTLSWSLHEAGGTVLVKLEHSGWAEAAPAPVAEGWKHFLGSLKAYLETGTGQPW
jgi:uncharacterized protein YndB with AHSA1/START domain